jgi:hypothetical protein
MKSLTVPAMSDHLMGLPTIEARGPEQRALL